MAPKEMPPTPGRTAQIVAVASLTLAIAVTVGALTGRFGRRAESAAAEPAPAEVPTWATPPAAAPAEAVSTPDSPAGPLPAPQPILLVPVQPATAPTTEPALPPSPDDLVATDWRGRGGDDDDDDDDDDEDHGRRHREEHDDDDD